MPSLCRPATRGFWKLPRISTSASLLLSLSSTSLSPTFVSESLSLLSLLSLEDSEDSGCCLAAPSSSPSSELLLRLRSSSSPFSRLELDCPKLSVWAGRWDIELELAGTLSSDIGLSEWKLMVTNSWCLASVSFSSARFLTSVPVWVLL